MDYSMIQQGWHASHALAVASLYENAFGHKFKAAIPSKAQRIHLLAESFNPDFSFVVIANGKIVGIAGYQTAEGSLTGGITLRRLWRVLGVWRGTWAAVVLSLFERKPDPKELIMDGIVVDPACRGLGLGSKLLSHIIAYASENQYQKVRLDVIDSNPRARKLYDEKGFLPVRTDRFPYLKWLVGFSGSTTMIYQIQAD